MATRAMTHETFHSFIAVSQRNPDFPMNTEIRELWALGNHFAACFDCEAKTVNSGRRVSQRIKID